MPLEISFPDFPAFAQRAESLINQRQDDLLKITGTQLLSFVQLAYRDKSQGKQGKDGIKWQPLKRATIEARVRTRAPAKRIVSKRKELAKQAKAAKTEKEAARLRKQRAAESAKLQAMIDREFARYAIGIDTGLQRNSAMPGYDAPGGGNVFQIKGPVLTIGFGRKYSKWFDADRKLIPEVLPDEWQQAIDRQAVRWAEGLLREVLP